MALAKRSTFGNLPSIFDDIFDRDFPSGANYTSENSTMPSVNIRETDKTFIIELAAPGMKKEDFRVELQDNILSISSEKKEDRQQNDNEKYTRQEFFYQSFRRTFTLPKTVAEDKIEAKYEDGVLKLNIPKNEDEEKQKLTKKIKIH
jgi:HSP20 family protein